MSEDTFVEGDRVQHVDHDSRFVKDGVIESITAPKRPKPNDYWKFTEDEQAEMVTLANIKWDDGSTESVDIEYLSKPDSELERQFRITHWATEERIQEKLEQASALISEAVRISEETGVAFRAYVSPLRNFYFPRSREAKFPDLDNQFVSDVTEAYNKYDSTGWQHSAVC